MFDLLWKSQQNKPENFAKNLGPNFAKNLPPPRTAALKKENFAQNFALQKPYAKVTLQHQACSQNQ